VCRKGRRGRYCEQEVCRKGRRGRYCEQEEDQEELKEKQAAAFTGNSQLVLRWVRFISDYSIVQTD
jgi:hypothetical protein